MDLQRINRRVPWRPFGPIVGFSVVLTAGFVGLVALVSGDTSAIGDRVPYYLLATAVAFVVTLKKLDDGRTDGLTVLVATTGIALGAGSLFSLSVEGVIYGVTNPGDVVASQLVVYFLAAALICTGLGMWGLQHWREFTAHERPE